MAKKRKRSWTRRSKRKGVKHDRRFPLAYAPAIVVPAASILGPANGHGGLIEAFQTGNMNHIAVEIKNILPYELIGYHWNGYWDFGIITRNLGLVLGGMAVDKIATMTGLNKQMRKIPMLGRYLKV